MLTNLTPVKVKMNLVAVAVAGVKPDTKVVSTSYTTRDNENRVNFTGRPAGQWVPGRYRVDIFVDDKPVMSREFAIQRATHAKPTDKSRLAGPLKKN
jgi:outer membrane usher protein FimD/PapC